jgi:uncharacterized protein
MSTWGFYGRTLELAQLDGIMRRGRWFFVKLSGRRRIGKTTLIKRALEGDRRPLLYLQIPDSGPAGVLSAVRDAFEMFGVDPRHIPAPNSLSGLAETVALLARAGYVVVLDEFQYFHRKVLSEFPSHLQREVDGLMADPVGLTGGLFVLGSIHTELTALLDNRNAPLYNRVTDTIDVGHLDIGSVLQILRVHADEDPERLLLLWNLFEGVPKFYRDCFEQGALRASPPELLQRMFLQSSAPLRNEAENWFLHELRGRYDLVLKFIARNPGCTNGDLDAHVREVGADTNEQTAGYAKILIEKYEMIERRLPILARKQERKGRYYVRDNFLRSWLAALAQVVAATSFRPTDQLLDQALAKLRIAEGYGFERLVAALYEERSRKGLPGFALSHQIQGYWNTQGTEIDMVAVDEPGRRIRFGSCKRSAARLEGSLEVTDGHIARFLDHLPKYRSYTVDRVALAPVVPESIAARIRDRGWMVEDLPTLTRGLV